MWIAFIEGLSITQWVMIFLVSKPAFIFTAIFSVWWTRRGREAPDALPGGDSPVGLLESDDLPEVS